MKKYFITFAAFVAAILGYKYSTKALPNIQIQEELSKANLDYAISKGFAQSYIAYEWTIDRDHDGKFDCTNGHPEQCDDFLLGVPKDKEIILSLDWESQSMEDVKAGKSEAIEQWVVAFHYFKAARPKALIGFYGMPQTRYYNRDINAWNKEAANYVKIMEMVDVYMPSLYDFYPDATTQNHSTKDDVDFVVWNVERALSLPKKLTYVYTMHRFHDNGLGAEYSTLITPNEWLAFVQPAINVRVSGRKIDGIIWWGADMNALQPWGQGPGTDILMGRECTSNKDLWPACLDNHLKFFMDESLSKLVFK